MKVPSPQEYNRTSYTFAENDAIMGEMMAWSVGAQCSWGERCQADWYKLHPLKSGESK